MSKRTTHVYYGLVECQALTLMNGDGPCQLQGVLPEGALYLLGDFFRLFIQGITGIGPFFRLHNQSDTALQATHLNARRGYQSHLAHRAIHIPMLSAHVILDEHHLRALFQLQHFIRRIQILGKLAFHRSRKSKRATWQMLQLIVIDTLGLIVMGDQTDIALFARRIEARDIPLVQRSQYGSIAPVLTDSVQHLQEAVIPLAIDGGQLDGIVLRLTQSMTGEEVRRVIILGKHLPLLVPHHGRQLLQVAYHQKLNPAKRLPAIPITPQHGIHRIQHVCPHHADLVDDQEVDAAHDIDFLLTKTIAIGGFFACRKRAFRDIGRKRKLEE